MDRVKKRDAEWRDCLTGLRYRINSAALAFDDARAGEGGTETQAGASDEHSQD